MIHSLGDIINSNFKSDKIYTQPDEGFKVVNKIQIFSNGNKNNYGKVLEILETYLPNIYEIVESEENALISNSNRLNVLIWYIDMKYKFTLKENLPMISSYSITDIDVKHSKLWISKPSHPYIGSGRYIKIGNKKNLKERKNIVFMGKNINWIIQPLLTNILLWDKSHKFDIRLFSIIYNINDNFYGASYKIGIGRKSVNIHDPVNDPQSAITNISIQSIIKGYDSEHHMPMIYDDIKIGTIILKELIERSEVKRDTRKKIQFLILGMDIIFLEDGTPKLIEVNEGPHLEVNKNVSNNEKIVSEGFILGAFGYILPYIINDKKINRLEDWDFC